MAQKFILNSSFFASLTLFIVANLTLTHVRAAPTDALRKTEAEVTSTDSQSGEDAAIADAQRSADAALADAQSSAKAAATDIQASAGAAIAPRQAQPQPQAGQLTNHKINGFNRKCD